MRLLAVLLVVGCVFGLRPIEAPPAITGAWVSVWYKTGKTAYRGSGAPVGKHLVATVAHMVSSTTFVGSVRAEEVFRIKTNVEDIVFLRVNPSFDKEEIFDIKPGSYPREIWTRRGSRPVRPSRVILGDSGSPVLDLEGNLVGHVSAISDYGRIKQRTHVSKYPKTFDPRVLKKYDRPRR